MKNDPHRPLREQLAFNFGIEAMLSTKKFGVCLKTSEIGTKKRLTLQDISSIAQVAVRKALIAYQQAVDDEAKEEKQKEVTAS